MTEHGQAPAGRDRRAPRPDREGVRQEHRGEAAGTDGRPQQPDELPRGHHRVAGRDGPPAVRPDHGADRPEAGDRGLMGLQLGHPDLHPHRGGLAQMVLGLGHDQLRLGRRDPQPGAQLRQVPGDQVGARPAHADHPGSACSRAGGRRPCGLGRPAEHRVHPAGEPAPLGLLGGQRGDPLVGQPVDAAPAALRLGPGAGQQAGVLQPVQGRVDGPLGQVERALAPVAQRRDDGVPVRGTGREHRQQQQVQVSLEPFTIHTKKNYA